VRVPRDEGVANHIDPESCAGVREGVGEALTGDRTGRAIEPRCAGRPAGGRRCKSVTVKE
jgi:hypothetical protein